MTELSEALERQLQVSKLFDDKDKSEDTAANVLDASTVKVPTAWKSNDPKKRDSLVKWAQSLSSFTKGPLKVPMARDEIPWALWNNCDLCGTTQADVKLAPEDRCWYIWDTGDMYPEWAGNEEWLLMCANCDEREMKSADEALDDADWQQATMASLAELARPTTGTGGYGASTYKPPTTTGYVPKKTCQVANHFTEINAEMLGLPSSFGYLRLASERGGKLIDTDCDYLLGFSIGWKDIATPAVKLYNPGNRPEIPILGEANDRSLWPACAFIDWQDMKAPNTTVGHYLAWAFKEWKDGKNIQFGCFGAHGRTGTFLGGLFLLAHLAETGKEAEDLVHKHHCEFAIETMGQQDWLDAMSIQLYGTKAEKAFLAQWEKDENLRKAKPPRLKAD